jgi:hypothetical protein
VSITASVLSFIVKASHYTVKVIKMQLIAKVATKKWKKVLKEKMKSYQEDLEVS